MARLGGDEFGALLTDASPDEVIGAAERLRQVTPELGSFSAGVATWDGWESLDELMRRCDMALYAAKSGGGANVEVAPAALESPEEARRGEDQ